MDNNNSHYFCTVLHIFVFITDWSQVLVVVMAGPCGPYGGMKGCWQIVNSKNHKLGVLIRNLACSVWWNQIDHLVDCFEEESVHKLELIYISRSRESDTLTHVRKVFPRPQVFHRVCRTERACEGNREV